MTSGNSRRFGFSLVELLVVIILVAVMAAIAIPRAGSQWQSTSERRARAQLKLFRDAADRFFADTGCYPRTVSEVGASAAPAQCWDSRGTVISMPPGRWRGPYLESRGWSTRLIHPSVRNLGLTFVQPTATTPYNIRFNTSQRTLSGENMGAW